MLTGPIPFLDAVFTFEEETEAYCLTRTIGTRGQIISERRWRHDSLVGDNEFPDFSWQ
jgi:hypothetical protein